MNGRPSGRYYYVESHWFAKFVFGMLLFNGGVLVLQTSVGLEGQTLGLETKIWQQWLACVDDACLMIFTLEWLLRLLANGMRFLTTSDCWFDFVVLAVSVPSFRMFGTSPVCAVPCKCRRFQFQCAVTPTAQMWLVSASPCAARRCTAGLGWPWQPAAQPRALMVGGAASRSPTA